MKYVATTVHAVRLPAAVIRNAAAAALDAPQDVYTCKPRRRAVNASRRFAAAILPADVNALQNARRANVLNVAAFRAVYRAMKARAGYMTRAQKIAAASGKKSTVADMQRAYSPKTGGGIWEGTKGGQANTLEYNVAAAAKRAEHVLQARRKALKEYATPRIIADAKARAAYAEERAAAIDNAASLPAVDNDTLNLYSVAILVLMERMPADNAHAARLDYMDLHAATIAVRRELYAMTTQAAKETPAENIRAGRVADFTAAAVIGAERSERIAAAVTVVFPANTWQARAARLYAAGKSMEEISAIMAIPAANIRKAFQRARDKANENARAAVENILVMEK